MYRFFIWCSGSDPEILKRSSKSEKIKHAGYGTLVLIPSVLALFAMTYAMSTLTEKWFIFIPAGIVWSFIVFSFDRFIISTFRKSQHMKEDIKSPSFIIRLIFALFIGFIVAHPLVMLYFDESIEEKLFYEKNQAEKNVETDIDQRINDINGRKKVLQDEISKKEIERNKYQEIYTNEMDGIISKRTTGIPGRGESAKAKEDYYKTIETELKNLRKRNLDQIDKLNNEIIAINQLKKPRIANVKLARDYIARGRVLEELSKEEPGVNTIKWFLIAFFVFVDILPITFKVMTKRGPYDDYLEFEEYKPNREIIAEKPSFDKVLVEYIIPRKAHDWIIKESHKKTKITQDMVMKIADDIYEKNRVFQKTWRREYSKISNIENKVIREQYEKILEELQKKQYDTMEESLNEFIPFPA